jgi:hypothetical protein
MKKRRLALSLLPTHVGSDTDRRAHARLLNTRRIKVCESQDTNIDKIESKFNKHVDIDSTGLKLPKSGQYNANKLPELTQPGGVTDKQSHEVADNQSREVTDKQSREVTDKQSREVADVVSWVDKWDLVRDDITINNQQPGDNDVKIKRNLRRTFIATSDKASKKKSDSNRKRKEEFPIIDNIPHKHNIAYRSLDFWGICSARQKQLHVHMIRIADHINESSRELMAPRTRVVSQVIPEVERKVEKKPSFRPGIPKDLQNLVQNGPQIGTQNGLRNGLRSERRSSRSMSPEVQYGSINESVGYGMPRSRRVSTELNTGTSELNTGTSDDRLVSPEYFRQTPCTGHHSWIPDFWHGDGRTSESVLRRIQTDFVRSSSIIYKSRPIPP